MAPDIRKKETSGSWSLGLGLKEEKHAKSQVFIANGREGKVLRVLLSGRWLPAPQLITASWRRASHSLDRHAAIVSKIERLMAA